MSANEAKVVRRYWTIAPAFRVKSRWCKRETDRRYEYDESDARIAASRLTGIMGTRYVAIQVDDDGEWQTEVVDA